MLKPQKDKRRLFTRRALVVGAGQLGLFAFLGTKLYDIQVKDSSRYRLLAKQNTIDMRYVTPIRGMIKDRYGILLAGNSRHWRALLISENTPDFGQTLKNFQKIIPLSPDEAHRIELSLEENPRYIPVLLKDYLSFDQMAKIEVRLPELPGVIVEAGSSRTYPLGEMAAHTIGYVALPSQAQAVANPVLELPGMRVGKTGIEEYYEPDLIGKPGNVSFEVDAQGHILQNLTYTPGVNGDTVELTLDAVLQKKLFNDLSVYPSASGVLIDIPSGEVLAMASAPSFDPSLFDTGVPEAVWNRWVNDERHPLLNKTTEGLYAPGSTFKTVVAMAALECGAITPQTQFYCPGYLKVGDHIFYCWLRSGHHWLDMTGGIAQSCDVYFYNTAMRTGIDNIHKMAEKFGIVNPLNTDFPNVFPGFVGSTQWAAETHKTWDIGQTVITGIGQGYTLITPFVLATQVARIASGKNLTPRFVRTLNGVKAPMAVPVEWPDLAVNKAHLDAVREGMWQVVNTPVGTAASLQLNIPGVQMAGKTGSAQVTNMDITLWQLYHLPWRDRTNGLFIGYAPFDKPRFAAAVVVEHEGEGATTAGPIVRNIISEALLRYGSKDDRLSLAPVPGTAEV